MRVAPAHNKEPKIVDLTKWCTSFEITANIDQPSEVTATFVGEGEKMLANELIKLYHTDKPITSNNWFQTDPMLYEIGN